MISPVNDNQIYEIGFLLSPFLPEVEAAEKLESLIKGKILVSKGVVLSSLGPKMIPLAYPMAKVVDNKKTVYRDAYFGAVKFELLPSEIVALALEWKRAPEIIRHLVIKTIKEVFVAPVINLETPSPEVAPSVEVKPEIASPVTPAVLLDEVIDREIAGMITP